MLEVTKSQTKTLQVAQVIYVTCTWVSHRNRKRFSVTSTPSYTLIQTGGQTLFGLLRVHDAINMWGEPSIRTQPPFCKSLSTETLMILTPCH